ncbi:MAG TPA: alpha-glucuronidase family glycosyl hydrolase [Vicinamibacterales bacterium]
MSRRLSICSLLCVLLLPASPARAESGYDLWLRYPPVEDRALAGAYRSRLAGLIVQQKPETAAIVTRELTRGVKGLLGTDLPTWTEVTGDGLLLVGTPAASALIAGLGWTGELARLGPEGFIIRSTMVAGRRAIVIASQGDSGALYGTFHLLRLLQNGTPIDRLDVAERPRHALRLLNHWDNLDGSIERGYAGRSLWKWDELPGRIDPRVEDYARANASIGINGTAINSVNAKAESLTAPYLEKAAAIANVFRPYGIRVYLSANFDAPRRIGGLKTADPLDPAVAKWWRDKAAEIYKYIPDFGGFLVKADSEGQPGPQGYGRTHADGANVLADALAPHGGIVMWRAFVYDADVDPDRVKRAYKEFVPLDGTFRKNVLVQVKNGPLDFQPREPFHPMFGAMPKTPLMAELQITQEYLGHANHLVYLAPMWKEFFDADTYAQGPGSTVAKVVDGTLEGHSVTGVAGVANTGSDTNWTGHHFGQANWYAFGRLAWNPSLGADSIADEWIRMTWSRDPAAVQAIREIMLPSREAFVDYTMPLGLHHLIGGDHYAVMPENPDPRRADWSAIYYHRADATHIGFDRSRNGSGAVDQYYAPLRDQWNDPATTPETLLLWFHRLPWDYKLKSGKTLWQGLVDHYYRGAKLARDLESRWAALKGAVDDERHAVVAAKLQIQVKDAAEWRDKCLKYFQTFSKRPIEPTPDGPATSGQSTAGSPRLVLQPNDRIILLGNTLAERMQHFNHFETLLMTRFPELQLTVRNLGWSADTITLQPRPLNFGDAAKHLREQKADVILAFFGLNESFEGETGLPQFERDLEAYVDTHLQARYNGRSAPRLVLVSPIAHEKLARLPRVDVDARNRELARYTEAMRKVAARKGIPFVDLFTPSRRIMESAAAPLTINGIHLNEEGDRVVAGLLLEGLGFADGLREAEPARVAELEALREAIRDKNQQFFYRWRPVNAEYVVGRRVEPFGSVNFPPEMEQLDRMVAERDQRIWTRARALAGLRFPAVTKGKASGAPSASAGIRNR